MLRRVLALLLVGTFFFASRSLILAQEEAPVKPASRQPKAAGDAAKRFDELLTEWKTVLKELRKLKSSFATAKPDETKDLDKQWNDLIAQGNELLPQLRDAGKEAYEAGGTVDPQLQKFLLQIANDAVHLDDYEVAYDLAIVMLQHEQDKAPPPKELYNIAGISAFMINNYDDAEKYHQLAKDAGTWNEQHLNQAGVQVASNFKKYRDLWEKEQAIREAEEKKNDLPRVKISTSVGDIVVELFEDQAPDTVGNFISLIEADFYNEMIFHRVLEHFMAQGGDPKGDGTGGPGYNIYDEVDKPDYRRHFRGTLSMAKGQFKDTGGSQFFICFTPRENLDGLHTAFGRVIEGIDVLAKIQRVNPEKPSSVEKTRIEKIEVLHKREHPYLPRKVE